MRHSDDMTNSETPEPESPMSQRRTVHIEPTARIGRLLSGDQVVGVVGDASTLVASIVAVKALGPFLEAFSKKLGERLGETTSEALSRIRFRRHIDVDTPGATTPTTLQIPDDFTDEAKIAALDLDLTAPEVRGSTLRWNPDTGSWEKIDSGRP